MFLSNFGMSYSFPTRNRFPVTSLIKCDESATHPNYLRGLLGYLGLLGIELVSPSHRRRPGVMCVGNARPVGAGRKHNLSTEIRTRCLARCVSNPRGVTSSVARGALTHPREQPEDRKRVGWMGAVVNLRRWCLC